MMAEPRDDGRDRGPTHIHVEKKKGPNWLPWLLLALGLLALLFALSRCDRDGAAPVAADNVATAEPAGNAVVAATPNADGAAALAGTAGIGAFLAGTEPTPRSFVFDKLNFDTGASALRSEDAAEVDEVAATLKQYPDARIRLAGYADARGSQPANMALGKARADSIKQALVERGIQTERIETVSGGEQDPVDSNATAGGRFENRRTELVVVTR